MNASDFHASLSDPQPPAGLDASLTALWWDGKDDWTRAHEAVAADENSPAAAWVHAYLHRKEGDHGNAVYWYRRAERRVPESSLSEEWRTVVSSLLQGRAA